MKSQQSTNTFVKETFMDLKIQLETVAKNHQASIQNLETKFDRLVDKQSGRPFGSLPSSTQPNPRGSKAYQPLQARNEHVNFVFIRSGKSSDPPDNLNDQQKETPINFDSDDEDDEPTPQSKIQPTKPVKEHQTLANTKHVSLNASAGRIGAQRNQTDEHAPPPTLVNTSMFVTGEEGVQENVDVGFADEGHGDNESEISGLKTQPSVTRYADLLPKTMEKPIRDKAMSNVEASYLAGRFGNLYFTPQWRLMDSSHMDKSRQFQDIMSNLFTPADLKFFNEGAFTEEHADLVYAYDSSKDVKAHYNERKKELATVQSAYDEKASAYDQLSKNYDGALTREKIMLRLDKERYAVEAGKGEIVKCQIINEYLPTFVRRLPQSNEYKRSWGEVFSLAIGKGFINGISIGRKDPNIQAILKATLNVDPASSDIFMARFEKLFDKSGASAIFLDMCRNASAIFSSEA
uniref:Transposase (Putative), gypsy type n=1 Tax=Tanacetum cinerariifolium TaxID=118510 RepID=A0A6L2LZ50_TANCI|nr:transposase (putative), gypsy type [Tanacetum cinerariifolium]